MEIKIHLKTVIEAGRKALFPVLENTSPSHEIFVRRPNKKGGYKDLEKLDLGKDPIVVFSAFEK
jgi:hypothetical protein